ncbi:MAG: tetratricopeptide repeat protein [Acidobacteriota bacterium]|nr:tetratricopeptide repeat protein [Acidobacteriota bacterium]
MSFDVVLSVFFLAGDLNHARAMLRDGRFPEALREMEDAMREAPGDPEIQYQIGELLREQAAGRAARLEELAPNSAEAHELLGRSLDARGNLDEALAAYRAAISKNPRLPGVHFLMGNIQWKRRDFEAAKPEMEAELLLNPHHALANLRLGQILLAMDQPGPAADRLRDAVRADDSSIEAHRALGKAFRALGNNAGALQEFRIVAGRRPQDDSVHAQLAAVYRSLGKPELVKAEIEKHRRLLQEKKDAARKTSPATAR